MILVSRCLAGDFCRWDGGTNVVPMIRGLVDSGLAVPACPEVLGGLTTPRKPSEIRSGRVVSSDGEDVTESFRRGAEETLRICRSFRCEYAILKSGSPSCGCGEIHNGEFDGGLVAGNGITAQLLLDQGIPVITEHQWLADHPDGIP